MKYFYALTIAICLSGCCSDALIDPDDIVIYQADEIDRIAHFDADCPQEEFSKRVLCAEGALLHFVYANIKYPADARENDIEGRVVVSFVIEKDGTISNVDIVKGIGYGCEEEVVRVVKLFPPWIPAIKGGKYVRMRFFLPVQFKIF